MAEFIAARRVTLRTGPGAAAHSNSSGRQLRTGALAASILFLALITADRPWAALFARHALPVLLGLYALSEVLVMIESGIAAQTRRERIEGLMAVPAKTHTELKTVILRGPMPGYMIGVIPGAGASIASFIACAVSKRWSPG